MKTMSFTRIATSAWMLFALLGFLRTFVGGDRPALL